MQLQSYDYEICYVKEKLNLLSDALSRVPSDLNPENHNVSVTYFEPRCLDLNYYDDDTETKILKQDLLRCGGKEERRQDGRRQFKYKDQMILISALKIGDWKY